MEQGHPAQALTAGLPSEPLGTAQSLPSLTASRSAGPGGLHLDLSFASKAWGSASFASAPDGTPILPASTVVRPKAKVNPHTAHLPYIYAENQHLNAMCSARPGASLNPLLRLRLATIVCLKAKAGLAAAHIVHCSCLHLDLFKQN